MRFKCAIFTAFAGLLATGGQALAHHSFAAQFDDTKPVRLVGKLLKMEWTNPHSYFYIEVTTDNGKVSNWGCEAGAPGALSRRGFKKGDIALGDLIVVDGYLAKDGTHLVDVRRVTLPNGRIVSGASAGDGGPDDGVKK